MAKGKTSRSRSRSKTPKRTRKRNGTTKSKTKSPKRSISTKAYAPSNPMHLAVPVHDLKKAKAFYGGLLGFTEGRSSTKW